MKHQSGVFVSYNWPNELQMDILRHSHTSNEVWPVCINHRISLSNHVFPAVLTAYKTDHVTSRSSVDITPVVVIASSRNCLEVSCVSR